MPEKKKGSGWPPQIDTIAYVHPDDKPGTWRFRYPIQVTEELRRQLETASLIVVEQIVSKGAGVPRVQVMVERWTPAEGED